MKKIYIAIIALCCAVSSCEGFLDVPPTNYADSSTSIGSAADAQVMMNGLLRRMTSSSYYGANFTLYGDAKGGDITIYTAGYGGNALYYFSHSANNNSYSGIWSMGYNCLLQANNIITNIEKLQAEGKGDGLEEFLGQALTIRALIHFDLVRCYGKPYNMDKASYGIPVVTEPVDARAQLLRNSVEEVYDQIISDLKAAQPMLSGKKNNGYINLYANKAILAKVLMYTEDFSGALAAAEDVINNGGYKLYAPEEWVASWTKQFGSESIFELGVYPNEADLGVSGVGGYYRRKGHGSSSVNGCFMASSYWFDLMGENDVRWGVMDYDQSADERANNADDPRYQMKGACYKYSGDINLSGDKEGSTTAVNIKVIRLSEVYLEAAEAALRTGDAGKAASYLNAIACRDLDREAYTASTVSLDTILDEFRREFLTEGKLFHEMCRLNKTIRFEDDAYGNGTSSPYRSSTIDRSNGLCRLPISQDEINANPGIGKQQNEGY